ncbi:probable cytochrome P450 313b1 [Stomoxys calcitrans]|uniref:probable cytochrome P450 313b1 n=1 Tax=Stomoxys calcitrans TaxID=35570 RepID=UPI0027E2AAC2|nr:probable cytochrome P450 313b1 [Stomoxys calcitrans]
MSFTLLLLMTTALMFWTGWLWSRRKFYSLYTKLPGPLGLPLIGICGKMMNTERFLKTLEEISVVYKSPCTTWLGTDCIVYISDPETVEKIFQSSVCTNKGHPYDFLTTVIGEGLFTSKSPRWNAHRRMLNPAFGRKIIETFIPIFNKESNVLIRKLSEIDNKTKDLYVILKKCVLEAACQTTLGQKMDFQDDGSKEIINAYTCVLETVIGRILSPWIHPDALYSVTSSCKLQQKAKNILNDFIGNVRQHV